MKLEWNLDDLFKNELAFYQEIEEIKKLQKKIDLDTELQIETFTALLNLEWQLKERANKILIYGSLSYYQNTKKELYLNMKKDAEAFSNEIEITCKKIENKIVEIGYERVQEFIAEKDDLEIYRFYIENLFRTKEHLPTKKAMQSIKLYKDQIQEQINLYHKMLQEMDYGEILIDGKKVKITTSNYGKYMASRNRNVRKEVYLLVNSAFLKKQKTYAELLNQIYLRRVRICRLENYPSVLKKALFLENLDNKIIEQLIGTVHCNLDIMRKYLTIKSSSLDISKPHLYDFNVPLIDSVPKRYTLEEAINIIRNAFQPLGEEYIKVVDLLLKNGHIDATLREEKHQSITFSWNTYSFLNFRGSYLDVKNLAHEIGHIVNYYFSENKVPFLYEDSSIFVGEIASIVNEILLNRYLVEKAETIEEKIFFLSKEIENYVTSVFRQTMYTDFESNLYQRIYQKKNLGCRFLDKTYDDILRFYYGDCVCYDGISRKEWMKLGHLYRHEYYPYKYATGLLMANIVVHSLIDENSLSKEEYIEFLSVGSSNYPTELLKILHIDFNQKEILQQGFVRLRKQVDKLEGFMQKKKTR